MYGRATEEQPPVGASFPFSYEDFEEWYAQLSTGLLEPARATFMRLLEESLDAELSDVDRLRIRVSNSRIKSPSRLWNKMLGPRYAENIRSLDEIPSVVDDLVGVRVTCNNLVDVEIFRELIISLAPLDPDEMPAGLCIDPESERHHNKESGYRAYHINLHTLIAGRNDWKPARGELQVRTLLQDSWGELTHEDTYKPGTHMPRLVNQLAKRMADLLATVDDLAQDLRNELDELAAADVAERSGEPDDLTDSDEIAPVEDSSARAAEGTGIKEALMSETRRVVEALTKPASLAQVAWQVQANFGREVTNDWGGFGSFKELLKNSAPGVAIVDVPPGTVIPLGMTAGHPGADVQARDAEAAAALDGVPVLLQRLKRRDSGAPAISSERLGSLLSAVFSVLDQQVWDELALSRNAIGVRELNILTKRARDARNTSDLPITRAHVDYVLKSLYFSQNFRPGLTKPQIGAILRDWIFARASRLGLVIDVETERAELEEWIRDASSEHP